MVLMLINVVRYKKLGINVLYDPYFWNVQAIAALFLWFNALYYMRSFDSTGYLIRSLTEVIIDMRVFLFLLGIVVFGFADAFNSANKA